MADFPGVGLPPMEEGMNKRPPKEGDDTPEGAKDKYSEYELKKEEAKRRRKDREEERRIIDRAVKRFKRAQEAEADNRKKALEDLEFKAGKQWPADIEADRTSKKRPCLTINGLPTLTHQVSNDIRQNRPGINVSPLGDENTKEAAELYASFIRAIERESAADIAYDTGVTSAVDIGFGYWRILTEFEDDDSFNQVIVVRRVRNAFTVLLDPDRQEPDGCDSNFGFVSRMYERDDFKEKWPNARPVSWREAGIGDAYREWSTKDQVRVAEYFEVTHEFKRLVKLSNGHEGFYDDLSDDVKSMIDSGELEIEDEREAETQVVDWYKMTSVEILQKQRWPGRWVPIVEVLGEEIDIEGKVTRSGIIRNAKDPMRMKNYWVTSKTELVAQVPKSPVVAPEGSFEGHENEWDRAVTENVSRLEYVQQYSENGQPLPKPEWRAPVQVPQGMVEAEKGAEQDLMRTTGVRFDAATSERLYDESGKAIKELRRNTDVGAFHFSDNMNRSLRHTGRIFLDLIPKVYNKRRVVPTVSEDGKESRVVIDPNHIRPTGTVASSRPNEPPLRVFNPTLGKYGVTITIGPSYATKRIEAQEQMMAFAKALPQQGALIAHLIAKYSDWPGSNEVYSILTKALPPNLQQPDMRDMPPQIAAFVQGLTSQIARLMAERTQMLKDLTDQQKDRALAKHKIDRDFEAKLMKLFVDIRKAASTNDVAVLQALLGAESMVKKVLGVTEEPSATASVEPSPISPPAGGLRPPSAGAMGPTVPGAAAAALPSRRTGGPVASGEPYVVGEEGPEIVVPDRNAMVLPSSAYWNMIAGNGGLFGLGRADVMDPREHAAYRAATGVNIDASDLMQPPVPMDVTTPLHQSIQRSNVEGLLNLLIKRGEAADRASALRAAKARGMVPPNTK